jgi:hypothetical protein
MSTAPRGTQQQQQAREVQGKCAPVCPQVPLKHWVDQEQKSLKEIEENVQECYANVLVPPMLVVYDKGLDKEFL